MFTEQQQTTLRHLMDRIIPPDQDPGAWELGAGDYLRRQLAGDLSGELDHYRQGLDALDAEARAAAGQGFAELPPEQQDALLGRLEAGQVVLAWPVDPARFFSMVVGHVIEGVYADPGNGGNRDGAAWRMIGYVFSEIQKPS